VPFISKLCLISMNEHRYPARYSIIIVFLRLFGELFFVCLFLLFVLVVCLFVLVIPRFKVEIQNDFVFFGVIGQINPFFVPWY